MSGGLNDEMCSIRVLRTMASELSILVGVGRKSILLAKAGGPKRVDQQENNELEGVHLSAFRRVPQRGSSC